MIMYKQKIIDIDLINLNNRHTFKQNTPKKPTVSIIYLSVFGLQIYPCMHIFIKIQIKML